MSLTSASHAGGVCALGQRSPAARWPVTNALADRRRTDMDRGDIASFTAEANDAAACIFGLMPPLVRH
ncbi:hypothetical protein ACWA5G_07980 [Xanthomonas axonopodis pv. ricini]|uniref:hypothetical protein n=1 Tax=Xanthomonas euvesicatoria TaxID=456327 RepID=UPI002458EC95|nr:hypothetical protein [Xanthomonas euvesicatoria]MDH4908656.1 hypothetical protein [Xanthomonas euvesicatoria]